MPEDWRVLDTHAARLKLANRLKELAPKVCPRCGHNDYTLIDGFMSLNLNDDVGKVTPIFGQRQMPLVGVYCSRCGAVFLHSALVVDPSLRSEEPKAEGK